MIKTMLFIFVAFFMLFGYIKHIEKKSIFFPVKDTAITPLAINVPFQDVYIEVSANIRINGWFIPKDTAHYTILFFHGNAGNIGDRLEKILLLRRLNLNIFIVDYRGYGNSTGTPQEKGLYADAVAAYNYLINERNLKPGDIIVYGESLGGAVAVDLASRMEIGGIILEGTFSKARDMARELYPLLPEFLFTNLFDSYSKIKSIEKPKLFLHSETDEIVPFYLAKKLYQIAEKEKYFVKMTGNHNSAFLESEPVVKNAIESFLLRLGKELK